MTAWERCGIAWIPRLQCGDMSGAGKLYGGRGKLTASDSRAEDAHAAQVGDQLVVGAVGAVADDCPASNHAQELVQGHALPRPVAPVPDGVVLQGQKVTAEPRSACRGISQQPQPSWRPVRAQAYCTHNICR